MHIGRREVWGGPLLYRVPLAGGGIRQVSQLNFAMGWVSSAVSVLLLYRTPIYGIRYTDCAGVIL